MDRKNRDLLTKQIAIAYVGSKGMKEFLPNLKLVQRDFENIGLDSIWLVETGSGTNRKGNLRDAYIVSVLNETVNELSR